VRHDLAGPEPQGLPGRQHGFVIRVSPNDVGCRMTFDYEAKKRIARRAAEPGAGGHPAGGRSLKRIPTTLCERCK